jgi:limonene-1,2-epoxide hydrolase
MKSGNSATPIPEVELEVTQVYRVKDDRIVKFQEFVDTSTPAKFFK